MTPRWKNCAKLDPMLNGLHFLLTYHCTYACDHCFVFGSPRARGTFTQALIEEALDQARALGSVEWIYFEGGEPFLYHPLLLAGLRAAKERGFRTGVVTNAYWANSVDDAELWLRPLLELDVEDLTLSDDPLHAGDVEETPAARAKEAAERIGLPVGVISIPMPCDGEGVRHRGRAADKLLDGLERHPAVSFDACPDEDLRDPGRVHLDADGHVHLCQGVLLGSIWETPLAELLAAYDPGEHPVVGPLLRGGPAALAEAHPEVDLLAQGYVSACHLCFEIRRAIRAGDPRHLGPDQVYVDP